MVCEWIHKQFNYLPSLHHVFLRLANLIIVAEIHSYIMKIIVIDLLLKDIKKPRCREDLQNKFTPYTSRCSTTPST